MHTIADLYALEILDSRGNPTVQVCLRTNDDHLIKAAVPSGASTGKHEACELRDGNAKRYLGKGVSKAVANVNGPIRDALINQPLDEQSRLDQLLITLDATSNKSHLGANAILGTSLAICRAIGLYQPLYQTIGPGPYTLPAPMMNIINGGAHADNGLDFQEFMIRPIHTCFSEALRYGAETFHHLKKLLHAKGHVTSVGDEGGFAPRLSSNEEALDFIMQAIENAGYIPGKDIKIAIDVAASGFYESSTKTYIEQKKKLAKEVYATRTAAELVNYLDSLTQKYPIDSIEDGLDENDWEGWRILTESLGKKVQIVGDDIFVTNPSFLQKGIDLKIANAILIKPNQIGTLTETLQTIALAKEHHYATIISHRSGETEDSFIADLAVATNAGQIKTGSLSRSDRTAKYNRLLEIEYELKRCSGN